MKKIIRLLTVLLLVNAFTAFSTPVNAQEDQSLAKVEEENQLVAAASGTLYPIAYYNEENELVGYMIDILREITQNMGVELVVKEMGADGMLTSLDNGQVDVVAEGFTITEDRQEKYLFSDPVVYSVGAIVVREEDDSGIESLEDFEGKKAAGAATTTFMQSAQELGAELVVYDNASAEQYYMDIVAGRTDFIPNDYYNIKNTISLYDDQYAIKMGDVFFNPSQDAFLFNKEAKSLVDRFNEELAKLRESGKLAEIATKYFDGDNPSEPLEEISGQKIEDLPVIDYAN